MKTLAYARYWSFKSQWHFNISNSGSFKNYTAFLYRDSDRLTINAIMLLFFKKNVVQTFFVGIYI